MGQANSSPDAYYLPTIAGEAAAVQALEAARQKRSQAEPLCRDKLRKPYGKELPPEVHCELKLEDISTSEALLSQLVALGASTPSCVYADEFSKKHAKVTTGRLSFFAGSLGRHIAGIFTDKEIDNLVPDGYQVPARKMPVFGRDGRRYDFELMYSEEHRYYRLAGTGGEYERFMAENNLTRDVVELGKKMFMRIFAFPSPKLLPDGKGFHHHPDGALGLILLFSGTEDEDEYAEWIELDDDSMTVKEMVEHIEQNQKVIY